MEYVCTGAILKCTMGTSCPKLKATPKNVSLTGKDQANIADYVPGENIPSFGRCRSLAYPPTASATAAHHGKLTPMPCFPGTCPFWSTVDKNSLICGQPALLEIATLKCSFGGIISIVSPGQNKEVKVGAVTLESINDGQQVLEQRNEILDSLEEAPADGENPSNIDPEEYWDNLQDFIGLLGFVPVAGTAADLVNAGISAARGNWTEAGLNLLAAIPGIGDVATGAKIAYRVTKVKSAGKLIKNTYKAAKRIENKAGYSRKVYDRMIDTAQTQNDLIEDYMDHEKGK